MPTILTHAAVGAGLAALMPRRGLLVGLSAALAMLPDLDVITLELGVPWGSMWSHRGVSHSLAAAVVAGLATACASSRSVPMSRTRLATYFTIVTASHGVLDALTNGGTGVAFLAPFRADRYFLPWRPIEVSPLGLAFFGHRGLDVLESELRWVWLPLGAVLGAVALVRRFQPARRQRSPRK
jgi:inner membrane protein